LLRSKENKDGGYGEENAVQDRVRRQLHR